MGRHEQGRCCQGTPVHEWTGLSVSNKNEMRTFNVLRRKVTDIYSSPAGRDLVAQPATSASKRQGAGRCRLSIIIK